MKKYDNFLRSLKVLEGANFKQAETDDVYRTGIAGQFNLTFELAWKAVQATLRLHSVSGSEAGSPREVLKLAYRTGFLDDDQVWLLMLEKRNIAIHVYSEEDMDELIRLIQNKFIPAFAALAETLEKKIKMAGESTWEGPWSE